MSTRISLCRYELSSAPLYAKSTTADIEEPGRVTVNAMIFVPPID
jgi:hypothetical protein